jgi:hypothetical protein
MFVELRGCFSNLYGGGIYVDNIVTYWANCIFDDNSALIQGFFPFFFFFFLFICLLYFIICGCNLKGSDLFISNNVVGGSMNFENFLLCCSSSTSTSFKFLFAYGDPSSSLDEFIFSCGLVDQNYVSSSGSGSTCSYSSPCLTITTILQSSTKLLYKVVVKGMFRFFFFLSLY